MLVGDEVLYYRQMLRSLDKGVDPLVAVCGKRPSSQYRAMVRMISDSGDVCRLAGRHAHGSRGKRLVQLVRLLDHAAAVV